MSETRDGFAGLPYDQQSRTAGTLDTSKEFRVHLRAWSQGQVAFADAILGVAPYLDHGGLMAAIESLRRSAVRVGSPYA